MSTLQMSIYTTFILWLFFISQYDCHVKRSIDLIAAHSLIADGRLTREVTPNSYKLELQPFPENGFFKGRIKINITWQETSDQIVLHAHQDLEISNSEVSVTQYVSDDESEKIASTTSPPIMLKIMKTERTSKQPLFVIHLAKALRRGTQCEVDLTFNGKLSNDTSEGLFRHSYVDPITNEKKWYIASHLRPNLARKVFPCFDEPAYKVPFYISIARKKKMTALSNMPLERTEEMANEPEWVWDHFQVTPPMSTFTVGIVVSEFIHLDYNNTNGDDKLGVDVKIWGRPDFAVQLVNAAEKVVKSLKILEEFWGVPYPLPKVDCLALPNYQATKPADNWGLILFKESELGGKSSWHITQELVYQWLGALATPFWWSDAHINNALARYITAYTILKLDENENMNWPMTSLYSIYYEFSKRYPHGKTTVVKQDSLSAKTELVFRMLNYTLGERTFKHGLQRFMNDRQFKTFFGDDIWVSLTEQARFDDVLDDNVSVNKITSAWVSLDRLPVVKAMRNYKEKSVKISQRVYLRERPHDVPDQEKYLWWIPIVMVTQDRLNFTNSTPIVWMQKQREIVVNDIPEQGFIIINPEEIGPFPVNYDEDNWNMLAQFLLNNEVRTKIPVNTRAKLLHDAWNLAYAGDLCFGTALNMTLFLKHEREYLAWDPVFTMIDHIGRHIDSSKVHNKFQSYVRILLTPLYEELGNEPQKGESDGRAHLRSSSKVFLCQAGYKPCIEEAQIIFRKWMEISNPDEGNPVSNQYICPVFKWGTKDEWEFGLQRVINFPPSRKASERTYLLKTLAGCPIDSWKVERLLNITVLEQNGNFSDNDINLIFSMLTGGSNGYTTLFHFLDDNWDIIKARFENKPKLWISIVTSATNAFKTQEGLDMVSDLYVKRQGDIGSPDFLVEKALRNIREESNWSNINLPVIESWLDNYLKENDAIVE